MTEKEEWTTVINGRSGWLNLNLKQVWAYRDLIGLFVKRDFIAVYKQTVLGPLWFLIQPVFSTVVYTVIFGTVANIPTDSVPPLVFYMSGVTMWNYFADCLGKTSNTFVSNAAIFGKVYFPRLTVPLSIVVSNLIKFLIQFLLFIAFLAYYAVFTNQVHPNIYILLTPFLLLIMAGIGLGSGIIISSLTTKYRDFQNLVSFGVQLLMYATPIVYPLSLLKGKLRLIAMINPITPVIEAFKYAYLGAGSLNFAHLAYSFAFMLVILMVGVVLFNKVEKGFMDTV